MQPNAHVVWRCACAATRPVIVKWLLVARDYLTSLDVLQCTLQRNYPTCTPASGHVRHDIYWHVVIVWHLHVMSQLCVMHVSCNARCVCTACHYLALATTSAAAHALFPPQISSLCKTSRSGPKAGGGRVTSRGTGIGVQRSLALFIFQCLLHSTTGARVVDISTMSAEAVRARSITAGHETAKPSGASRNQCPYNEVRKRAFRRAIHRAVDNGRGGTFYRGRWLSLAQLERSRLAHGRPRSHANPAKQVQDGARAENRIHAFCWNTGGLSTGMLDEFLEWLDQPKQSHISIVMLQETHWGHDAEWSSSRWHFVHSGDPHARYAGVLCMISTKLAQASQIAYEVLHPGRLLHLRVGWQDISIDIINIYQVPWNTRSERQALIGQRGVIWGKLEKVLSGRTRRNHLILAGDFNGQLPQAGMQVGTATIVRNAGDVVDDMPRVLAMLGFHELTALNTWRGPRSAMHTYSMGSSATQIDFIITASEAADGLSKQCVPLSDFPVGAWKLDGLRRPLISSIRSDFRVWKARSRQKRNPLATSALLTDPAKREALRDRVRSALNSSNIDATFLNQILIDAGKAVLPADDRRARQTYHTQDMVRGPICRLWQCWQSFKSIKGTSLTHVLQSWRALTSFRQQKRAVQKASRQIRKQFVDDTLKQAVSYGLQHNIKGVYDLVRKLAPKQVKLRIQIRDEHGKLLTPSQELEELRIYYTSLFFQGVQPPLVGSSQGLQFTTPDISAILNKVPFHKASPAHCAPGALWKVCSDLIAPHLQLYMEQLMQQVPVKIPSLWKDAWLALLAKPQKKTKRPETLRPVGLQCMGGKAMMRLICDRLKPYVQSYATGTPQMAYLPQREGAYALLRAFSHCRNVRDLVRSQVRTVFHMRQGVQKQEFVGGCCLSLDLSQAFDRIPRTLVILSLREAGAPEALINLVTAWHLDSRYHINHGGASATIPVDQGIRQGCVLAPLLWSCATVYLLKRLDQLIALRTEGMDGDDSSWSSEGITAYADDFLASCVLRSKGDLALALIRFQCIIELLQSHNLVINFKKSAILFKVAGTQSTAVRKRMVRRNSEGEYISLDVAGNKTLIPVVERHDYMGMVLSYDSFEDLSFQKRFEAAGNNYKRLKKFLHSRLLPRQQRVRMWSMCVWTSLSYGLSTVGITPASAARLRGLTARHWRAIAQSPRHLTGETTEALQARLGLKDPMDMLVDLCASLLDRLGTASQSEYNGILGTGEIWLQAQWAYDNIVKQRDCDQRSHVRLVQIPDVEGLPCDMCGLYFPNERALRTHMGHMHPEVNNVARELMKDIPRHDLGVDGMPICRRCGFQFFGWQNLLRHVQRGRCRGPVLAVGEKKDEATLPLVQRTSIVHELARTDLGSAVNAPELCAELARHCVICFQWIGDTRHVKTHIMNSHPEIWDRHKSAVVTAATLWGKGLRHPCQLCGLSYSKCNRLRHARGCTVLMQCLLAIQITTQPEAQGPHGHGSGNCFLSAPPAELHGAEGYRAGGSTGQETSQVPEVRRQGRCGRQGQRPGTEHNARQQGIQAWFRKAGPEGIGGESVAQGSNQASVGPDTQVRGRTFFNQTGSRLRDVPAHPGHAIHSQHDVRAQHGVEATAEGGQGQVLFTPDSLQVLHDGASGQAGFHGLQAGGSSAEPANAVDGEGCRGEAHVALSQVRCGQEGGDPRPGQEAPSSSDGHGGSQDHHPVGERGHTSPVQCDSTDVGLIRGGHALLSDPGFASRSGGPDATRSIDNTGSVSDPQPDGRPHPEGAHSQGARRSQAVQTAGEHVRTLVLLNSSNVCYQNSFILSIMWAYTHCSGTADNADALFGGAITGRLVTVLQRLLRVHVPVHLHHMLEWGAFLQDWRQPQRQHDISEFASFVLQKAGPPSLQRSWQSREADGGIREIGELTQPIGLRISGDLVDFQACVDAWHHQEYVHALHTAAPLVCVQLGRFQHGRRITKIRKCLRPSHVHFPVFRDATAEVMRVPYRLISMVMHMGSSPNAGHYRAILMPSMSHSALGGESSIPDVELCQAHVTDDGVTSELVLLADIHNICCNCYLCWFIKL